MACKQRIWINPEGPRELVARPSAMSRDGAPDWKCARPILAHQELAFGFGATAAPIMRKRSSGSGKTTVVFFSTPISVSVCR